MGTTVLDEELTMVKADITFAKAAALHSNSSSVLSFSGFVQCLRLLANEKYQHTKENNKNENTKKKKRKTMKTTIKSNMEGGGGNKNENENIVPVVPVVVEKKKTKKKWRNVENENALLLQLLHNHCYRHIPSDDINPLTHHLEIEQFNQPPNSLNKTNKTKKKKKTKIAEQQEKDFPEWSYRLSCDLFMKAEIKVLECIITIQNFVRCEKAKSQSLSRRYQRAQREKDTYQNHAATIINSKCIRYILSKRKTISMAQNILTKWIDYESGVPYWKSSNTSVVYWKKPQILSNSDCLHVIDAPHPHVEYALLCR